MENIWNEAQEKVHNGSTFRINLEKRNLLIDGKYIIKEGEYEGNLGQDTNLPVQDILTTVEDITGSIFIVCHRHVAKLSVNAISEHCQNMNLLKMTCSMVKIENSPNCVWSYIFLSQYLIRI